MKPYHLWMKTSLLQKLLRLNTELLYLPGCTRHGKPALMSMLTELFYWHIKETLSMCVFVTTRCHPSKPLFPSEGTFSNLILIMALSLLRFQLLQPLGRLFFWPKIYKKKTPKYSLFFNYEKSFQKQKKKKTKKYTIAPTALGNLLVLFFSSTKILASEISHLSSFSALEGSTLPPGAPSCGFGDLKSWAELTSPGPSHSCLFRSWA